MTNILKYKLSLPFKRFCYFCSNVRQNEPCKNFHFQVEIYESFGFDSVFNEISEMISNIVQVRFLFMLLVYNEPIIISRNSKLESRLLKYLFKYLKIFIKTTQFG